MWYAPIGSVEYVRNLHNDKKIKEYLLNENRLKNNKVVKFTKKQENDSARNKADFRKIAGIKSSIRTKDTQNRAGMGLGKPMTMKTQSAVLVQIFRSYRKTSLDVVSYAKNLKNSGLGFRLGTGRRAFQTRRTTNASSGLNSARRKQK